MLTYIIILGCIVILLVIAFGLFAFFEHNYGTPTLQDTRKQEMEEKNYKKTISIRPELNNLQKSKRLSSLKLLQTTNRPFNKYLGQINKAGSRRRQMLMNWEHWKRLYGPNGIFNPNNPNNPNSWLNRNNPASPFHH